MEPEKQKALFPFLVVALVDVVEELVVKGVVAVVEHGASVRLVVSNWVAKRFQVDTDLVRATSGRVTPNNTVVGLREIFQKHEAR